MIKGSREIFITKKYEPPPKRRNYDLQYAESLTFCNIAG